MMFKISLRMACDVGFARPKKWSTTLYGDRVDANSAAQFGRDCWISYLRAAARENVFCYEVYASSLTSIDDTFATVPVPEASQRGSVVPPAGEPMPIEHCLAVPLLVANSRPDRKFWRVPLFQSEVVDGEFTGATIADIVQGRFNAMIAAATDLKSQDGEPLSSAGEPRASYRRLGRQAGFNVPLGPPGG